MNNLQTAAEPKGTGKGTSYTAFHYPPGPRLAKRKAPRPSDIEHQFIKKKGRLLADVPGVCNRPPGIPHNYYVENLNGLELSDGITTCEGDKSTDDSGVGVFGYGTNRPVSKQKRDRAWVEAVTPGLSFVCTIQHT